MGDGEVEEVREFVVEGVEGVVEEVGICRGGVVRVIGVVGTMAGWTVSGGAGVAWTVVRIIVAQTHGLIQLLADLFEIGNKSDRVVGGVERNNRAFDEFERDESPDICHSSVVLEPWITEFLHPVEGVVVRVIMVDRRVLTNSAESHINTRDAQEVLECRVIRSTPQRVEVLVPHFIHGFSLVLFFKLLGSMTFLKPLSKTRSRRSSTLIA